LRRKKFNIYGNGIAFGHPVVATGARIFITLMYGLIKSHTEEAGSSQVHKMIKEIIQRTFDYFIIIR